MRAYVKKHFTRIKNKLLIIVVNNIFFAHITKTQVMGRKKST